MKAMRVDEPSSYVGVTVMIATFNRAEVLRRTLEAVTDVDRECIDVEFVVIDNNSSDHTGDVIASFENRLPLRHFFESRPGKNCALNKALDEVKLRDIVVFTDDDVVPRPDWLSEISQACARYKDCSVFGGRIDVGWPDDKIPPWAEDSFVRAFGFSAHDLGGSDVRYAANQYPFGPNFWVRRGVFADGRRYNEAVGPRPSNRIMGSETTFLKQLADDDYTMMFIPSAGVRHCIQAGQVTKAVVRERAYRLGRSGPHFGLCRATLLRRLPMAWRALRVAALVRYAILYSFARCVGRADRCMLLEVRALQGIGYNVESLALVRGARKKP